MKYKWMKKDQKKVNQAIRRVNNMIAEDSLWKGRFTVRQNNRYTQCFNDGSGGVMAISLIFYDKKTKRSKEHYLEVTHYFFINHLLEALNEFIVEFIDVWHENPGPRDDTVDYRTIE